MRTKKLNNCPVHRAVVDLTSCIHGCHSDLLVAVDVVDKSRCYNSIHRMMAAEVAAVDLMDIDKVRRVVCRRLDLSVDDNCCFHCSNQNQKRYTATKEQVEREKAFVFLLPYSFASDYSVE